MEEKRCFRCIYSNRCGECKKGFNGYTYDCYFESKYIFDDETGEIVYSEEDEENIEEDEEED